MRRTRSPRRRTSSSPRTREGSSMTGPRLEGRTAMITGGCSGIGLATVRRFLEEGAKVVIGDVDDARGAELAEELSITYVHVDVTSKDEVDALFKTAKDTYGSVDIAF